jgi:IS5 family transposase
MSSSRDIRSRSSSTRHLRRTCNRLTLKFRRSRRDRRLLRVAQARNAALRPECYGELSTAAVTSSLHARLRAR